MNTVKEYKTAYAVDAKKLDREVKALIQKGFQPYGFPYVQQESETQNFLIFQAMVQYVNEK